MAQLSQILNSLHLPIKGEGDTPLSSSSMIDSLIEHFIEPLTVQPTFLLDHPILLSPLARRHRNKVFGFRVFFLIKH
jgi:lysyl-tRNA synthetase class 2